MRKPPLWCSSLHCSVPRIINDKKKERESKWMKRERGERKTTVALSLSSPAVLFKQGARKGHFTSYIWPYLILSPQNWLSIKERFLYLALFSKLGSFVCWVTLWKRAQSVRESSLSEREKVFLHTPIPSLPFSPFFFSQAALQKLRLASSTTNANT